MGLYFHHIWRNFSHCFFKYKSPPFCRFHYMCTWQLEMLPRIIGASFIFLNLLLQCPICCSFHYILFSNLDIEFFIFRSLIWDSFYTYHLSPSHAHSLFLLLEHMRYSCSTLVGKNANYSWPCVSSQDCSF